MELTFTQFCTASPAAYQTLHRYVDDCGRQGKSYEFPACRMPEGCVPDRAILGFLRRGEQYLLYWRPSLAYRGDSRVLAALFSRSLWRFPDFDSLSARLRSLRPETAAPCRLQPLEEARPRSAPSCRPTAPASPWPRLYRDLKEELGRSVLGQEEALEAAAYRLFGHVGKKSPSRPLSLIFYGPTGVGKSELGRSLAPALERCCGQRYRSVWTDLNTFTEAHSVHRLTGAPPGYVGYEDPPIFESVRRDPRTVFLFDELEKAHPEVLKVFMSILDEGRCTAHRADEDGERELDFRRCVLVFTTNADLSPSGGRRTLGFTGGGGEDAPPAPRRASTPAELAEQLFRENEEARRAMIRHGVLREIAGRFSGLIGFHPLDREALRAVTVKQIAALGREYGLEIVRVDPDTAQALTPGPEALSARSTVAVLEGRLTPLLVQLPPGAYRLTGGAESLRLLPVQCGSSSSVTRSAATSSW